MIDNAFLNSMHNSEPVDFSNLYTYKNSALPTRENEHFIDKKDTYNTARIIINRFRDDEAMKAQVYYKDFPYVNADSEITQMSTKRLTNYFELNRNGIHVKLKNKKDSEVMILSFPAESYPTIITRYQNIRRHYVK